MTDLLDRAVIAARNVSPELQDEIARVVLAMASENSPVHERSPQEIASLAASRDQALRGEYATDGQVRAVWAKHDL